MVLPLRADAGGSASFVPAALHAQNVNLRGGSESDGGSADGGSTTNGGAFVSFPVAGKHLAFDGRLLHGCPFEMASTREHTMVMHRGKDVRAR